MEQISHAQNLIYDCIQGFGNVQHDYQEPFPEDAGIEGRELLGEGEARI